jgi:LPS-assembly lipoprotein
MSKRFQASAYVLAGLLAVTLTGCGFYLKGDRPLPAEMSEVYLDYRAASYEAIQPRLEESLRTNLQRRGARVVSSATAPGRLTVYRLEEKTRVLSVGSDGNAIEYEIEATVEFDYSVDGRLRVPRETLTVLREYSYDETRVLAKEAERRQLQKEMQEELADLVLLRVDAQLANPQLSDPPIAEPAG